jgi:membrane-bound metal-dependent hydrolase YbcI (DUF457 family)
MPHAVTHVLVAIVLFELFRHYFVKNKKAFPIHYILIGGLAALLPDIDVAVFYILSFFGFTMSQVHRTFTHTLLFPLLFVLLAIPFWTFKNKQLGLRHLKLRNILLVIAFGIFIHLALDALIIGSIMPLYPFTTFSIGLNLVSYLPLSWQDNIIASLDALILIAWLISLEFRHKLSSFI